MPPPKVFCSLSWDNVGFVCTFFQLLPCIRNPRGENLTGLSHEIDHATGLPPPVQFPDGFVTSVHNLCENCGNDPSFFVHFRYML